ncbi:MAG TPA: hypothetical protein VIK91_20700 [Nannocystis sp.]
MGRFSLELDDVCVGEVVVADGEGLDVEPWIRRREGAVRVLPRPGFLDWVDGSLYGERRRGALVAFDAEGQESERLVFAGATILEVGMPRIEPSGDPALKLRVRVEATEFVRGGTATPEALVGAERIAGARLVIDGESPESYEIIRFAPLSVKIAPGHRPAGAMQRLTLDIAGGEAGRVGVSKWVGREARIEYLAAETSRVIVELACVLAAAAVDETCAPSQGVRVALVCRGLGVVTVPGEGDTQGGQSV